MDLIRLSQLLSTTNLRSYRDDDFWVDRLSHRFSVIIFSTFAILVTTKAYIGDPIDCWAPPEFKVSYERYAETLCFVNGTYYISPTEIDIPSEPGERYSNRVRYYQWTPFILLLQAFFMFLPRAVWLSLNTKYGIHLRNLVDAAKKYESVDACSNREKIIFYLCKNLLRSVKYREYKANKKVLNAIQKDIYRSHQLELNSLLTLISAQPALAVNVLNNGKDLDKRMKNSRKDSKMKPSKSFDDLQEEKPKKPKQPNNSELYTGNECRLKYVTFKTDQTRHTERHNHRGRSSRSHSSQNLSASNPNELVVAYNPAYYIIDPKVDTQSLMEYLNNSMALGTQVHLESPLDLINSKITNISHKHLLNMLTSGCYQVDNIDEQQAEVGSRQDKQQMAYLINSDLIRHIESSTSSFARQRKVLDPLTAANTNMKPKKSRCALFNFSDKYLYSLYVFVKFLYLLSALCQLVFLNRLIGNNFYILGFTLIKTFFMEIEWPHLEVFPRMTLCEIYIREVGTTHPYLIQCVLRINLFNEVIFVCVWYWLLFVLCATAVDLVQHLFMLFVSCSSCKRKLFALKYLELVHLSASSGQLALKKFAAKLSKKKRVDVDSLLARSKASAASEKMEKKRMNSSHDEQESAVYYDNNLLHSKAQQEKPINRPPSSCSYSTSEAELSHYEQGRYKQQQEVLISTKSNRSKRLLNYLNHKYMLIVANEDEQFELFERFCETNFNNDTIFSLRVIEQNASSLIVSEIVEHLWTQYKALNCVYSTETNDYLLKKLFVFNDLGRKQSSVSAAQRKASSVTTAKESHRDRDRSLLIEKL